MDFLVDETRTKVIFGITKIEENDIWNVVDTNVHIDESYEITKEVYWFSSTTSMDR